MYLSEKELFQLLVQRYQHMEGTKTNVGRDFKPVKEVLDEFVERFNSINNSRSV